MEMPDVTKIMHEMNENTAAITADRDRLQAINAELVAALEKIVDWDDAKEFPEMPFNEYDSAQKALAKAKES